MGWKQFAGFCIFLAAAMPLALADGPTQQKARVSIEINAPAVKVWAKLRDFQDMSWHPAIAKTEGTGGNAANATRILLLQGGGSISEYLDSHDDAMMTYAYRIGAVEVNVLPVTGYSSRISVAAAGENKSVVTWQGAFYRGYPNNDPPAELNDEASVSAVTTVYRVGLENLKKLVENSGS